MMKLYRFPLCAAVALAVVSPLNAQTTATTDPVGFVTVGITAGTGSAKKNTLFSVPLLEAESISGQVSGVITGVSSNSISNTNAGWTAGWGRRGRRCKCRCFSGKCGWRGTCSGR